MIVVPIGAKTASRIMFFSFRWFRPEMQWVTSFGEESAESSGWHAAARGSVGEDAAPAPTLTAGCPPGCGGGT